MLSSAGSNSAEFARVLRSPVVCGSWNALTRDTPCGQEIFRQATIRETGKKADRPDGRIEIVRSRRHDVTALELSRFLPPLIWFEFEKVKERDSERVRSFFSVLRDIWEDWMGWKKFWISFWCENFGRKSIHEYLELEDFKESKEFQEWFGDWNWKKEMDVFEEWRIELEAVRNLGKKQVTSENYTRGNFRFLGEWWLLLILVTIKEYGARNMDEWKKCRELRL